MSYSILSKCKGIHLLEFIHRELEYNSVEYLYVARSVPQTVKNKQIGNKLKIDTMT